MNMTIFVCFIILCVCVVSCQTCNGAHNFSAQVDNVSCGSRLSSDFSLSVVFSCSSLSIGDRDLVYDSSLNQASLVDDFLLVNCSSPSRLIHPSHVFVSSNSSHSAINVSFSNDFSDESVCFLHLSGWRCGNSELGHQSWFKFLLNSVSTESISCSLPDFHLFCSPPLLFHNVSDFSSKSRQFPDPFSYVSSVSNSSSHLMVDGSFVGNSSVVLSNFNLEGSQYYLVDPISLYFQHDSLPVLFTDFLRFSTGHYLWFHVEGLTSTAERLSPLLHIDDVQKLFDEVVSASIEEFFLFEHFLLQSFESLPQSDWRKSLSAESLLISRPSTAEYHSVLQSSRLGILSFVLNDLTYPSFRVRFQISGAPMSCPINSPLNSLIQNSATPVYHHLVHSDTTFDLFELKTLKFSNSFSSFIGTGNNFLNFSQNFDNNYSDTVENFTFNFQQSLKLSQFTSFFNSSVFLSTPSDYLSFLEFTLINSDLVNSPNVTKCGGLLSSVLSWSFEVDCQSNFDCFENSLSRLYHNPEFRLPNAIPHFDKLFNGTTGDDENLFSVIRLSEDKFRLKFSPMDDSPMKFSLEIPLSELEFLQPKVFIESTNLISLNQFSILASINVSNIGNLEGNLTVICNCFGNNVVISNYFYEILAVNETMEISFLIESFEDTVHQDFSCQISSLFDSLPLWEQSNLTASWEFDIFTAEFPENCFYPELVPISFVQNNMCEIFDFEPFLCQTRQDWIDGDEVSDCLTINQNDWIPYYELLSDQEQLSYKNYLFKNISVQFLVFEHSEKIPFKLVIEAETCPGDTCHDVIFTTSQSTEFFTEKLELVSSFPENLIEFSFVVGVDYSLYKDDDLTLKFSLEILADPPCDCWLIDKTLGKSLTFDSITFPVSCPNPLLPSNVLNIDPSSPLWNDGVISYNENIIFNSIKNGPLFLTANSFDKKIQIIDGSHVFLHLSNINFEILNIGPTDTLVTAMFNISSQNLDYFEVSDFDLIGDVSFDCSSTFSIVIDELSGSLSCVLPAGQSILIGLNISTPYLTEFSANISIFPEKLLCMDDSYGGIISHYFNLIATCNENYPEKSKFSIELADFAFKSDNCAISDQNFSPCFNSSLTISNLASFDIEGNFELFCWSSEDQSIPVYPSSYTFSLPFFQSNLIEIVTQTVPGTELFCNVTVNTDPSVLHNPCSHVNHFSLLTSVDCVDSLAPIIEISIDHVSTWTRHDKKLEGIFGSYVKIPMNISLFHQFSDLISINFVCSPAITQFNTSFIVSISEFSIVFLHLFIPFDSSTHLCKFSAKYLDNFKCCEEFKKCNSEYSVYFNSYCFETNFNTLQPKINNENLNIEVFLSMIPF
ncbi:hypothetical protein RCL1_004799 [Eukaryota sp. TZLM3-RCL]